MTETWKAVPGYEGRYEVSDRGRVRSLDREITCANRWGTTLTYIKPGQVLRSYINTARGGYSYVNLHAAGRQRMCRVAVLVAQAFLGPRPKGEQVMHRDGRPANDRLSNLAYGTPKQNAADKLQHGTHLFGERSPLARLTEDDVKRIRSGQEPSAVLAEDLEVHVGHINNIRRGVRWTHA